MSTIGIDALGSEIGSYGGVEIYTRSLIEALANYERSNTYVILVYNQNIKYWSYRHWPENIIFAAMLDVEPRQPIHVRAGRRLLRLLKLPIPATYGDPYLKKQIEELKLDLIHYPRTILFPSTVNVPCLLTFFDLQHEYFPQFFTQTKLEERRILYKASVDKAVQIIVPSRFTYQTLVEKFAIEEEKLTVLPVGINNTFRRQEETEINRVKLKYNLTNEFIYYPANPWLHKNHARLISAIRIYKEKYGSTPLLVLSGRLQNENRDVKSLAIAAGVEDDVVDLGFVPSDDLPALYSAATLLVFPSLFEGFGIPLLEAMACGCPIVAANTTSIPEIVKNAALLVNPYNSNEIADTIHLVLNNSNLRKSLTEKGFEQVKQFDWELIIMKLASIYKQLITKSSKDAVKS